jgi:hypothetical protein
MKRVVLKKVRNVKDCWMVFWGDELTPLLVQ